MSYQKQNVGWSVLVMLIIFYGLSWINAYALSTTYKPITTREITETEQAKIYLVNKVSYNDFKKWNKIISAESSWNQHAVNQKTKDFCLTQVNEKSWDAFAKERNLDYKNDVKDCIDLSLIIKEKQGWSAWRSSVKKHHVI